jgi:hypothetical protein
MEPRKRHCTGADVVIKTEGNSPRPSGRAGGPVGVEERSMYTQGLPRNLGDLLGSRLRGRVPTAEDNEDVGTRGQKSECPIVALNPGNLLDGTWWSEGDTVTLNRRRDR